MIKRRNMCKRVLTAIVALFMCMPQSMPLSASAQIRYAGDLRWDFITDREGFEPKSNASVVGISNGALVLTSSGDDPNITASNVEIKTDEHRYLRFRIKNSSPTNVVQAYFYYSNPWQSFNVNSIPVEPNSNEFKEYEVDLYSIENRSAIQKYTDKDTYPNFRFDFMNGSASVGSEVELDYIVLSNNSINSQNRNLITGVSVGDCEITNFNADADYCETELYSDLYDSLTADNVTVSSVGGDTDVRIRNITDRKIIDIVVASDTDDYARTYRIVCKSVRRPPLPTKLIIGECGISGKTVTVSGYLTTGDVRRVSIVAHPKGGGYSSDEILYMGKFKTDADGNFKKSFTLYDDETSPKMYEAEILLDTDGESAPVCGYVMYVNGAKLNESLNELKADDKGILDFMTNGSAVLIYENIGVWINEYLKQDDETKKAINDAAEKYRKDFTAQNVVEIANGSILSVLFDKYDIDELVGLTADFDKNAKELKVEGKRFFETDEGEQKNEIKNIKEGYDGKLKDYKQIEAAVRENMLLSLVNKSAYTKMKDLLLNNTDILNNELLMLKNQTNIKIVDEAMRTVTDRAKSIGFKTSAELTAAVENAVAAAEDKINKTDDSKTGGGGGGGSKSYNVGVATDTVTPTKPDNPQMSEKDKYFDDLDGYEWAANEINKLSERGVVNGVSNRKFNPSGYVTREEFVKLMIDSKDMFQRRFQPR